MTEKPSRSARVLDALDVCGVVGFVCFTAGLLLVLGLGSALLVDGALLLGGAVYAAHKRGGDDGGSAS